MIGVNSDKPAIILDIGQICTKVGFAGDLSPRFELSTYELIKFSTTPKYFDKSFSEWIHVFRQTLRKIFSEHLLISTKERRIVICQDTYWPSDMRDAVLHILFNELSIASIHLANDMACPLYLTGLSTGIVIQAGYAQTRLLSVLASIPIVESSVYSLKGIHLVHTRLSEYIQYEYQRSLSPADLEKIRLKACYVKPMSSGDNDFEEKDFLMTDVEGGELVIKGENRWQIYEEFFSTDEEEYGSSIQELIVESIRKCNYDTKKQLMQNILLCGGLFDVPGMRVRVIQELVKLLKENHMSYLIEYISVFQSFVKNSHNTWTGASILGTLDGIQDITNAQYKAQFNVKPE